jgi:hypothetical protein
MGILGRCRLSRVYARAIASKPVSIQFSASERLFFLSYSINIDGKQYTKIFVPSIQYPQSSDNIIVNNGLKWRVDPTNLNLNLAEPSNSKLQAVLVLLIFFQKSKKAFSVHLNSCLSYEGAFDTGQF